MKACGLIVEYNPFHHGHLYHLKKAREQSHADCIIAIMSGPFLQRGEPAIIDKFSRAKAALQSGVDIILELPYYYAVQSSDIFARGALLSLAEIGVSTICFGSELGNITPFLQSYRHIATYKSDYSQKLQNYLNEGYAYPTANQKAFEAIGNQSVDLFQPNNILGYSYVKAIHDHNLPIQPLTIKRKDSQFHETKITSIIASATSIRHHLFDKGFTQQIEKTLPQSSVNMLKHYKQRAQLWHQWETYFPLLRYRILTMTHEELAHIQGVDEGLEYRIKNAIHNSTSFNTFIHNIKTKRYTFVRLQRMLIHVLTHTSKNEIEQYVHNNKISYLRLLGMSETGRIFLNKQKNKLTVPLISNLQNNYRELLHLDEKATHTYYSVLQPSKSVSLRKQEFQLPLMLK